MNTVSTTIIEFDMDNQTFKNILLDEFEINLQNQNKIYWIHSDLNQQDNFNKLIEKLRLPEQIVQLCIQEEAIPKIIETKDSLAIQIECLLSSELVSDQEVKFGNLIFYLTSRYCFTASSQSISALFSFEESYEKNIKYAKTPCFILFLILDNIINDFSRLLLDFELLADQIDLHIRENQDNKNIYSDVMNIKKQVMKIQHHIATIRDVLMRVSGRMIVVISDQCRASLASLLDHSQIIFNEAGAIREILKNTLDQIDNALMQRMNSTMKVLTAFAAIFLPLSLIAGIYGMNFHWIPELQWKYGYFWALGLMLCCGLMLYGIFRWKKWF